MSFEIKKYNIDDSITWDEICANSINGTFLHTRKFLSYHKDKFEDYSVMIYEHNKCVAILPAARDPSNETYLNSHPGITYGSLIHTGNIRGNTMITVFHKLKEYYSKEGFKNIIYKPTPLFYHENSAQDDIYALQILGAKRFRCDVSSTLDLKMDLNLSSRRKRGLKNAKKNNTKITEDAKYLNNYWEILEENLKEKFKTVPVHSYQEINLLRERFPNNIQCIFSLINNEVTAGIIIFINKKVIHAQYISSNYQGRFNSSLDYVFDYAIKKYRARDYKWFDFGISTKNNGLDLNEGLFKFKSEFGAGTTVYEFYNWKL